MVRFNGCLDKMKEQKADLEQKLKTKSNANPPTPPSYNLNYPQLLVPYPTGDLLDIWVSGIKPPISKPSSGDYS